MLETIQETQNHETMQNDSLTLDEETKEIPKDASGPNEQKKDVLDLKILSDMSPSSEVNISGQINLTVDEQPAV